MKRFIFISLVVLISSTTITIDLSKPTYNVSQSNNTNIDLVKFNQDSLNKHNEYRRKHGAAEVVLDDTLIERAQWYAEQIAEKESLTHSDCYLSDGKRIGENLYYSWNSRDVPFNTTAPSISWCKFIFLLF